MNVYFSTHIVLLWCLLICSLMGIFHEYFDDPMYYRFGPHPDFKLLGFTVDTYSKYFMIIVYTFINTYIRNINSDILKPWVTHNLENTNNESIVKRQLHNQLFFYEITFVSKIFFWVDWFIYMNMLLSQIDMILIEGIIDIIVSFYITHQYLKMKVVDENNLNLIN